MLEEEGVHIPYNVILTKVCHLQFFILDVLFRLRFV